MTMQGHEHNSKESGVKGGRGLIKYPMRSNATSHEPIKSGNESRSHVESPSRRQIPRSGGVVAMGGEARRDATLGAS